MDTKEEIDNKTSRRPSSHGTLHIRNNKKRSKEDEQIRQNTKVYDVVYAIAQMKN